MFQSWNSKHTKGVVLKLEQQKMQKCCSEVGTTKNKKFCSKVGTTKRKSDVPKWEQKNKKFCSEVGTTKTKVLF